MKFEENFFKEILGIAFEFLSESEQTECLMACYINVAMFLATFISPEEWSEYTDIQEIRNLAETYYLHFVERTTNAGRMQREENKILEELLRLFARDSKYIESEVRYIRKRKSKALNVLPFEKFMEIIKVKLEAKEREL